LRKMDCIKRRFKQTCTFWCPPDKKAFFEVLKVVKKRVELVVLKSLVNNKGSHKDTKVGSNDTKKYRKSEYTIYLQFGSHSRADFGQLVVRDDGAKQIYAGTIEAE